MCICSQSFWKQLINERWCSLSNCIILFIIHYCVIRSVRGWVYRDMTNVWQQNQRHIVRFQHIQSSGCLLSVNGTRYSRPRPQPPLHNPCPELRAANCWLPRTDVPVSWCRHHPSQQLRLLFTSMMILNPWMRVMKNSTVSTFRTLALVYPPNWCQKLWPTESPLVGCWSWPAPKYALWRVPHLLPGTNTGTANQHTFMGVILLKKCLWWQRNIQDSVWSAKWGKEDSWQIMIGTVLVWGAPLVTVISGASVTLLPGPRTKWPWWPM